eukprot:TCONS_00047923-protein
MKITFLAFLFVATIGLATCSQGSSMSPTMKAPETNEINADHGEIDGENEEEGVMTQELKDEIDQEILEGENDGNEEDDDEEDLAKSREKRFIRFRRIRVPRIRIRLRRVWDRVKCPTRCASYRYCMIKAPGIAKLACNKIKKNCRCGFFG